MRQTKKTLLSVHLTTIHAGGKAIFPARPLPAAAGGGNLALSRPVGYSCVREGLQKAETMEYWLRITLVAALAVAGLHYEDCACGCEPAEVTTASADAPSCSHCDRAGSGQRVIVAGNCQCDDSGLHAILLRSETRYLPRSGRTGRLNGDLAGNPGPIQPAGRLDHDARLRPPDRPERLVCSLPILLGHLLL